LNVFWNGGGRLSTQPENKADEITQHRPRPHATCFLLE